MIGNVKEALVPFVKQKVKEWKLKKQDAKKKKELDEKEGKDKAAGDKKSDKPKELDSPLMNQAEIESTMAEYEVLPSVSSEGLPVVVLLSYCCYHAIPCKPFQSGKGPLQSDLYF